MADFPSCKTSGAAGGLAVGITITITGITGIIGITITMGLAGSPAEFRRDAEGRIVRAQPRARRTT